MGFIYLALAIAYVIVSAIIILLGGWIVKAFGKRPRRWYIGAAIASFLILFWDYIPTYLLYRYYCSYQCGLSMHKTLSIVPAIQSSEKALRMRANPLS